MTCSYRRISLSAVSGRGSERCGEARRAAGGPGGSSRSDPGKRGWDSVCAVGASGHAVM